MAVQFSISSPKSDQIFSKELTHEEWGESEYKKFFNRDMQARSCAFPWTALVIPVRVNNLRSFSEDFFLPNTVNLALKTDKLVTKILLIFGCFLLDAVTFPIRLLTAIPWAFAAPKKEDNEVYKFLNQQEEILNGEYVTVELKEQREPSIYKIIPIATESTNRYPLIYMSIWNLLQKKGS